MKYYFAWCVLIALVLVFGGFLVFTDPGNVILAFLVCLVLVAIPLIGLCLLIQWAIDIITWGKDE